MFSNKKIYTYLVLLGMIFSLAACQPKAMRRLEKMEMFDVSAFEGFMPMEAGKAKKYRCKIDAYGQKISGILVVKKQERGTRMLMMTDFGLKVIDIIFRENGSYQINYLMKHLDYPMVRKAFALNLQMLLTPDRKADLDIYRNQEGILVHDRAQSLIYFLDKANKLQRVQRYHGNRKLLAEAKMQDEDWIFIQQYKPSIVIKLKSMDDVKR